MLRSTRTRAFARTLLFSVAASVLVVASSVSAVEARPLVTESVVAVTEVAALTVTHDRVKEKTSIPFKKVSKKTDSLDKGTKKISVKGVNGVKTKWFKVTYEDGVEVDRSFIKSKITKKPVKQVTLVGTHKDTAANCDPNYEGECVPIAYDVDCAGGSGDGPGYADGPVYVVGNDIYDLDRDGDGVGCD